MNELSPADLLSAYLDGELAADEVAAVEEWLAQDPVRRQLLAELAEVRRRVRELPLLEPPPEVAAMLAPASPFGSRRSRTTREARHEAIRGTGPDGSDGGPGPGRRGLGRPLAGAAVGAVVLAVLLLVGGTSAVAQEMPVGEVVAAYEGRGAEWSPADQAGSEIEGATAPEQVPARFELQSVTVLADGLVGLRFADGDTWFSVFEQHGRIDWPALREHPGERMSMDGDPAWTGTVYGHHVVLVERGERVYMVMGQDGQLTRAVSAEMAGDGGPTVWERIGRRCHDTLQLLGLRG